MVRAANERTPVFYLGCTLWMTAVIVLIKYDLGVIAFVLSVLVLIWVFGLRDKFESETTASAYSVFNKDGQGITGGFTTAQLERQLRGGLGHDKQSSTSGGIPELDVRRQEQSASSKTERVVSDNGKVNRRKAAAAAAERRLAQREKEQ